MVRATPLYLHRLCTNILNTKILPFEGDLLGVKNAKGMDRALPGELKTRRVCVTCGNAI